MAFKLNIYPEIDRDINRLMKSAGLKSKTEYINRAVAEFNDKLKRLHIVNGLKSYFESYQKEACSLMQDFSKVRL